jgi:hypothetical protein
MPDIAKDQASSQPPAIKPEDIHMPPPSFWPIVLALGVTLILAGLAIHFSALIFGVILSLVAAIGWVTEPGYEYPVDNH